MDFSSQLTWDVILEIAGFLAAAGLGSVVHAWRADRRVAAGLGPAAVLPESDQQRASEPPRRMQFIRFGESSREQTAAAVTTPQTVNRRPDRTEIVRLAREMIKAGATRDRIQRVLPISETELVLLGCKES